MNQSKIILSFIEFNWSGKQNWKRGIVVFRNEEYRIPIEVLRWHFRSHDDNGAELPISKNWSKFVKRWDGQIINQRQAGRIRHLINQKFREVLYEQGESQN